ncbi:MAG: V-type ATPase 116kDa subunit family protein, partial [Candidatus Omnitrophota bacterium]
MITPAPMELLSLVVLKEKLEEVSLRLLKLGNFHPVDIRQIEDKIKGLSSAQMDKESQELESLQAKIKDALRKLKLRPEPSYIKEIPGGSYAEAEKLLGNLEQELAPLLGRKEELNAGISTNEAILAQVREQFPFALRNNSFYSFIEVSTGKVEEKNIIVLERSLQGVPHVVYVFGKENSRSLVLLIGLRRDRVLINKILKDVDWEAADFSKDAGYLSKEAQTGFSLKIEESKKSRLVVEEEIKLMGARYREGLLQANAFAGMKKSLLETQKYFCLTEKTALFSGWVPRDEKEKIISEIKSMAEVSYIESLSPEVLGIPKDEIPVRFQHGALIKPFELLVDAYGIPRYGTIDPTIFVAFSFLLMFGAMFGDLGHGLVLVLLGLFIGFRKHRSSALTRQTGTLIFYCGSSSAIFGLLYGSVFGFEFNSFWLKPMNDIMGIFRAGIFLGIIMITLGIIINIINSFRDKDYAKAVFDKAGLIGGLVYWAAIGLISKKFFARGEVAPVYSYLI